MLTSIQRDRPSEKQTIGLYKTAVMPNAQTHPILFDEKALDAKYPQPPQITNLSRT